MMIKIGNKWLDGLCCLQKSKPVLHSISALPTFKIKELCVLCQTIQNANGSCPWTVDRQLLYFPWTAAITATTQGAGGFLSSQMY